MHKGARALCDLKHWQVMPFLQSHLSEFCQNLMRCIQFIIINGIGNRHYETAKQDINGLLY